MGCYNAQPAFLEPCPPHTQVTAEQVVQPINSHHYCLVLPSLIWGLASVMQFAMMQGWLRKPFGWWGGQEKGQLEASPAVSSEGWEGMSSDHSPPFPWSILVRVIERIVQLEDASPSSLSVCTLWSCFLGWNGACTYKWCRGRPRIRSGLRISPQTLAPPPASVVFLALIPPHTTMLF